MIEAVKKAFLCCRVRLLKSMRDLKTVSIAAMIFAFFNFHLSSLAEFSEAVGIGVTPWVFPHLMSPAMLFLYGVLTVLLFSDAPFFDEQTYYAMVRSGRTAWALGQLFYIAAMSFIYTLFMWACSVVVLLPHVELSPGWGKILKTLAIEPGTANEYGAQVAVSVDMAILNRFGPVEATLLSLGLMWLSSTFLGTLVFACNALVGKFCGLIAAGTLVGLAYFQMLLGGMALGSRLGFLSPVSWVSLKYLSFTPYGPPCPSVLYAVCGQGGAILLMGVISIAVFRRRDIHERYRCD